MLDVKIDHSLFERGSNYYGPCDVYGRRDGDGTETWRKQEQRYDGTFVKDAYHGQGSYQWLTGREKLVFEGRFFSDFKEGYGLVSFPDGSSFEGLFCNNRPFGPGVQTYVSGRQDVGFWCGRRIVRLSRSVDFIIPRLASSPVGKLKLLRFQTLLPFVEDGRDAASALLEKYGLDPCQTYRLYSSFVRDPRSLFFNRTEFDRVYFVRLKEFDFASSSSSSSSEEMTSAEPVLRGESSPEVRNVPAHCLCAGELVVEYKEREGSSYCDPGELDADRPMGLLQYYTKYNTLDGVLGPVPGREDDENDEEEGIPGEAEERGSDRPAITHLISWNRTELCMEMLRQIFRFRSFEDSLTFKISDLMAGVRTKFRKTGEREKLCVHFLKMCSMGPAYVVKEFLCSKEISEALMDARGNNSVMFAAAADRHDVIDVLLNYGADVNSFNDENLTPLNLCLLRRIAQSESLGNWEVSFLPPEQDTTLETDAKGRPWRATRSIRSLDRIFGDGMSIGESDAAVAKDRDDDLVRRDSVFSMAGEKDSQGGVSSVTMLRVRKADAASEDANTPTAKEAFVPSSNKREEFARSVAEPTDKDKYHFDLSPRAGPEEEKEGGEEGEAERDRSRAERLTKIDQTITQLLVRGADPNLADVPKPSLHLAVFSRDLCLVRLLLNYGACPDSHTLPQEGLLTPLHVVVLMRPSQKVADMCELLVHHGASPEEETAADFDPAGDDQELDPEHGRTPLQLLCMRSDAESVDSEGFLGQMAHLLVGVSKQRHFFRGHSFLTLAMLSGNQSIMKALLGSGRADPNEILGNNRGTAFHVLVSTEMQRKTKYSDSIRMCDLLFANNADPYLSFKAPPSLAGTCVDYGYRQIEEERARRGRCDKFEARKGEFRRRPERDYLEEHEKVVEYIEGRRRRRRGGTGQRASDASESAEDGAGGRRARGQRPGEAKDAESAREKGDRSGAGEDRDREEESAERKTKWRESSAKADAKSAGTVKIVEIKKKASAARKGIASKEEKGGVRYAKGPTPPTPRDRRSGSMKRRSTLSDRLPERLRQSLLQMYGACSGGLDLNDLLLPYVVLRNGDLYYRFKGQKPAGVEQYSLI